MGKTKQGEIAQSMQKVGRAAPRAPFFSLDFDLNGSVVEERRAQSDRALP